MENTAQERAGCMNGASEIAFEKNNFESCLLVAKIETVQPIALRNYETYNVQRADRSIDRSTLGGLSEYRLLSKLHETWRTVRSNP